MVRHLNRETRSALASYGTRVAQREPKTVHSVPQPTTWKPRFR